MRVKIKKSSSKQYWYKDKIGHVFNVLGELGGNYLTERDGNGGDVGIGKSDCIVIPEDWCVEVGDDTDTFRKEHPVIIYLNKHYGCCCDGSATYYGVKKGNYHFRVGSEGRFGELLTLEEFEFIFLDKKQEEMKKLVGYELNGKVSAEDAASFLKCGEYLDDNGCFFTYPRHFATPAGCGSRASDLGILDIWFKPVFKEIEVTKTLTLGTTRVEIEIIPGKSIMAAANKFDINAIISIYNNMHTITHTLPFNVTYPYVKIGCSTFAEEDMKQIIDAFNGK